MLDNSPGYRRPIEPLPPYGSNLLGYLPASYADLPRYRTRTAPDPTEIQILTADLLYLDHRYLPYWAQTIFGDRAPDDYSELQLLNEETLCGALNFAYSPAAIMQALHINVNAIESGQRRMTTGWYEFKARTDPVFVYNFLRYALRNELFPDLESALEFVRSPLPQLQVQDVFQPNKKIISEAAQLPSGKPVAFIHGRYLSVPHPGHESGIAALGKLKLAYPELLVVVGIDHYGNDTVFANNNFRQSLLAQMPDVDFVLPLVFPEEAYALQSIYSDYTHPSPLQQLPLADQNAFYENLYARIFAGRQHKFLHINTAAPSEMTAELRRRCELFGIVPVERSDKLWQSSILTGYYKSRMRQDPQEELLEHVMRMRAAAAAECAVYAKTPELCASFSADYL